MPKVDGNPPLLPPAEPEFQKKSDELAETQKSVLDNYARQTAALMDCFKSVFPMMPPTFFDVAKTDIVEFARMQMRMIDLITKQSKKYVREIDETVKRAA